MSKISCKTMSSELPDSVTSSLNGVWNLGNHQVRPPYDSCVIFGDTGLVDQKKTPSLGFSRTKN